MKNAFFKSMLKFKCLQKHEHFSKKDYRCLWLCYKLFYPSYWFEWPFEQLHLALFSPETH